MLVDKINTDSQIILLFVARKKEIENLLIDFHFNQDDILMQLINFDKAEKNKRIELMFLFQLLIPTHNLSLATNVVFGTAIVHIRDHTEYLVPVRVIDMASQISVITRLRDL